MSRRAEMAQPDAVARQHGIEEGTLQREVGDPEDRSVAVLRCLAQALEAAQLRLGAPAPWGEVPHDIQPILEPERQVIMRDLDRRASKFLLRDGAGDHRRKTFLSQRCRAAPRQGRPLVLRHHERKHPLLGQVSQAPEIGARNRLRRGPAGRVILRVATGVLRHGWAGEPKTDQGFVAGSLCLAPLLAQSC